MTLKELNVFFTLICDLSKTEEILENLRNAACPSAQIFTGMPHASGAKDKLGDLSAEIVDMEYRKKHIESKIALHKDAVETFVSSIEDSHLRTIFRLRFERGLSWKEVAAIIGGGNNDVNVKQACYRYLKNS